jgi:hypothetical protein
MQVNKKEIVIFGIKKIMKNKALYFFILLLSVSCSSFQSDNSTENSKDSLISKKTLLPITNDSTFKAPFWIIALNAFTSADSASAEVENLKKDGKDAGYLWIPDYSTLSGKKMYCVFLGPFYNEIDAGRTLIPYKKENPGAYAVKCDHNGSRYALYSSFDIRRDDKKMGMVIIYSTPSDEKAYAEEGGEDWGWFINDVGNYMSKEVPDVYYGVSLCGSWFSDEEIKSLEKELDMNGFGYIMIKGNEKSFTPHDTPNSVIYSICEFFGKEYNENWNSGE